MAALALSAMVRPPTAAVLVASLEITVLKMIPVSLSVLMTLVNMEVPARRHSVTQSFAYAWLAILEESVR